MKAVVSQQGEDESAGRENPLEEIGFWHRRGDDLAGICAQLDSPGQQHTCQVFITCMHYDSGHMHV